MEDKSLQTNSTNSINNNIFNRDKSFMFIYKKTERLATALYMVTNLFSDAEPMKWTLRKRVSDLLSFAVGYKDISSSYYVDFTHSIQTKIFEIVSLLDVSTRAGLISQMNFEILQDEFLKLVQSVDSISSSERERHAVRSPLPNTFFEERQEKGNDSAEITTFEGESKGHDIAHKNVFNNNRQNIILQVLKKKKEVTIKDIADVIRNCSEKTIQRELVSLIEKGIIQKTGERRWSKYSLRSVA